MRARMLKGAVVALTLTIGSSTLWSESTEPVDLDASFVYHAANRDEVLPRKTLPKPPNPRPTTTAQ